MTATKSKRLSDFVGETVFEGLSTWAVKVEIRPHGGRRVLDVVTFDDETGPGSSEVIDAESLDLIDKCLGAGWVRGSVGVQYDWRVVVS